MWIAGVTIVIDRKKRKIIQLYLPRIIGWVENKERGSNLLYDFFRKETLK